MAGNADRWAVILVEVAHELEVRGETGWIVGGCLRDALLGVPVRDVDLAVTGEPIVLAEALRIRLGAFVAPLSSKTIRVVLRDRDGDPGTPSEEYELDVSALRGATIEDDLRLRDFRVNALALSVEIYGEFLTLLRRPRPDGGPWTSRNGVASVNLAPPHLLDPLGGIVDLRERALRLASPHAFSDEPGRILRAARLMASHGFAPVPEVVDAARAAAPLLHRLPRDRLRDEMSALLALPRAWEGLAFLAACDALTLLGEKPSTAIVEHALASVRATEPLTGDEDGAYEPFGDSGRWYRQLLPDRRPRVVALRWGLLLHAAAEIAAGSHRDAGGDAQTTLGGAVLATHTRAIVSAVRGCAEWRERLAHGVPDDAVLRHFFAGVGDAGVDMLVGAVACDAAWMSASGEVAPNVGEEGVAARARVIVARFFADRAQFLPPPLLTGTDLMRELGLSPGPVIKTALQAVRTAQLDGAISTREQALDVAACHVRSDTAGMASGRDV